MGGATYTQGSVFVKSMSPRKQGTERNVWSVAKRGLVHSTVDGVFPEMKIKPDACASPFVDKEKHGRQTLTSDFVVFNI